MRKRIVSNQTLKKIPNITLVILIISVGFIAFDQTRFIGGILALTSLVLEWRLYRCPYCNKALDPRLEIEKDPYCPHCGKKI